MATLPARTFEPAASEALTWAEICAAYPDQWVGVVEVVHNSPRALDIKCARVVSHGRDPREVLRQLRPMRTNHTDAAHYFTGRIRAPFPRFP